MDLHKTLDYDYVSRSIFEHFYYPHEHHCTACHRNADQVEITKSRSLHSAGFIATNNNVKH